MFGFITKLFSKKKEPEMAVSMTIIINKVWELYIHKEPDSFIPYSMRIKLLENDSTFKLSCEAVTDLATEFPKNEVYDSLAEYLLKQFPDMGKKEDISAELSKHSIIDVAKNYSFYNDAFLEGVQEYTKFRRKHD
jgi:hypothetical protein